MLQSLRPELSEREDHEELTGLDILMEGEQKHSSVGGTEKGEGSSVMWGASFLTATVYVHVHVRTYIHVYIQTCTCTCIYMFPDS